MLKQIFMRSIYFLFIVLIGLSSCNSKIDVKHISYLNGYWEIEKVTFPDGQEKEYKVNETVDYFALQSDTTGFRVKVMPQLDGSYISNKIQEKFQIVERDEKFYLLYKTDYAEWEEELIAISNEALKVKNSNDIVYQYKRNTLVKL